MRLPRREVKRYSLRLICAVLPALLRGLCYSPNPWTRLTLRIPASNHTSCPLPPPKRCFQDLRCNHERSGQRSYDRSITKNVLEKPLTEWGEQGQVSRAQRGWVAESAIIFCCYHSNRPLSSRPCSKSFNAGGGRRKMSSTDNLLLLVSRQYPAVCLYSFNIDVSSDSKELNIIFLTACFLQEFVEKCHGEEKETLVIALLRELRAIFVFLREKPFSFF